MESLYRKYRPQTFDSMVGQKHIVMTLENALAEGRTAHAYLFSGPRGTGKTTTARLLAKALLCEHGPTPHPDGTCEQCEAIAAGAHPDVYELDAASRTGVDNVREEIINRVAFAPTRGRYKIYIIDEVHMLTTAAFNALLKTLEEPPSHVVFVMCTTDPQKVPDTILSRCQRLEFHRITTADIEDRLAFVCKSEGFEYDEAALGLVAKHARGGLRDALSTLEQLSVFGDGAVRLESAQSVLGEVPDEALSHIVRMVARRDVAGCFAHVADLAERGVDVAQYVRDLTRYVRNVYVASVAGSRGLDDPSAEAYAELANELGGSDRAAALLDQLGRLESELRTSLDQRLSLEVALTRMARPAADLTLESLAVRVAQLERELADLRAAGGPAVRPDAPACSAAVPGAASAADARHPAPRFSHDGAVSRASNAAASSTPPASARPQFQPRPPAPGSGFAPAAPAQQPPAPHGALGGRPDAVPPAVPGAALPTPQPHASASAPTAPRASSPQTSMDAAEVQRLWGRVVDTMMRTNSSVGALLRNADGVLSDDGTLTVTNRGSAFAAQMMARPASLDVLSKVAAQVYGRPVRISVAGVGAPAAGSASAAGPAASPAAPARLAGLSASAPASRPVSPSAAARAAEQAGAAAAASTPSHQVSPVIAPASGAISAAAIAAAAAAAVGGAPVSQAQDQSRPAFTAAPVPKPDPSAPGRPPMMAQPPASEPPRHEVAQAFRPEQDAPRPAAPAPDEAPGYEFVPDEVYDAYDVPEDDVPHSEADEPAAMQGGLSSDLSQMLSAGFGGYVKVTEE